MKKEMDQDGYKECIRSIILDFQELIDSGTLMPDQMEAAMRTKRILQKIRNAHSEQRIKNLSIALTKAIAEVFLKETSRNELRSKV